MERDEIDAERAVGEGEGRRDLGLERAPGVMAPQAMTPKPPALEIAATRLRSDTQVMAPPMIAALRAQEGAAALPQTIEAAARQAQGAQPASRP